MSQLTANQRNSTPNANSARNGKDANAPGKVGLVIDTSIVGVAVAVVALDGASQPALWQGVHETTAGSLEQIASLVADGCRAAGLSPRSLDAVCLSTGPGSFTGIKVGLAFGYGLAAAHDERLKLRGDSGLAAAACALQDEMAPGRSVLLFLPATRTHGFVAKVGADGREELSLVHVDEATPAGPALRATELLAREGEPPLIALAGNWPLLLERLEKAGHPPVHQLTAAEAARLALGRLAARAAKAWPQGYASSLPEPRYLRLSTAEEKLAEDRRAQVKS